MPALHVVRSCLSAMRVVFVNAVTVDLIASVPKIQLTMASEAYAKSSGGRSGGGSLW